MMYKDNRTDIEQTGFAIIPDVFSSEELAMLATIIEEADRSGENFRMSAGLFAIRQFFKEIPDIIPHVFIKKLNAIIKEVFGADYFIVKSIYFDKPEHSNWFVAYHQDLTIAVKQKKEIEGYGPWTAKQNQFSVQPPFHILNDNFTIRIHLDDADDGNGALYVIPGSHRTILRPERIERSTIEEVICNVPQGGIMIMKPLLMHASKRSVNKRKRRVIHIEFTNKVLPEPLEWSERIDIDVS